MPKRIEVVRDWCWEQVCDEVFQIIGYKAGTLVHPESICQELARGILQTDIWPEAKLVENGKIAMIKGTYAARTVERPLQTVKVAYYKRNTMKYM